MTASSRTKNCCVLIPYWIANQVQRNGWSMDTVTNLEALLKICSVEDVAGMLVINTNLSGAFVGGTISDSNYGNITVVWGNTYPDLYKRIATYALAVTEAGIVARLTDTGGAAVSEITDLEFHHLAIKGEIAAGLGFVLPKGIWFGENHRARVDALSKQYLKKSFGFSKFDQLATDGVFKTYLDALWSGELQPA